MIKNTPSGDVTYRIVRKNYSGYNEYETQQEIYDKSTGETYWIILKIFHTFDDAQEALEDIGKLIDKQTKGYQK